MSRLSTHPLRLDVVKVLIARGADVNAVTEDGRTPMDIANDVHGHDLSLVDIVRTAGGKEGKELRRERGQ
jgi:ankyrin repeat protein